MQKQHYCLFNQDLFQGNLSLENSYVDKDQYNNYIDFG